MGVITIKKVSPIDEDVLQLIEKLNQFQCGLYGDVSEYLETGLQLKTNNAFMLGAFTEDVLIGIGAIKMMKTHAQIKRMFINEDYRGKGISLKIMKGLEAYAFQNKQDELFLETGNLQLAAHNFYSKIGYHVVESFESYQPNGISVYFRKKMK